MYMGSGATGLDWCVALALVEWLKLVATFAGVGGGWFLTSKQSSKPWSSLRQYTPAVLKTAFLTFANFRRYDSEVKPRLYFIFLSSWIFAQV